VLLTGADIYGIAVEDLESAGREVDNWLNAPCAALPFERSTDTKKLIEDFTRALGANSDLYQQMLIEGFCMCRLHLIMAILTTSVASLSMESYVLCPTRRC
jgi:hypothetical protein